ncbi:14564_t:CDS:2, partial [Dentiscutata erythropus]
MKSQYRLQAKQLLFSFDRCYFDPEDILQHIRFVFIEKNITISSYYISTDKQNIKAFVILDRRINLSNSNLFELDFGEVSYTPTIESFRSLKTIRKYFKKNKKNRFITNIKEINNDKEKKKLLEFFEKIFSKRTIITTYYLSNYIIVSEPHRDGNSHKHVYLKLDKKIRIRKETFFDIKTQESLYHPNIQGVRSTKSVIDYILKFGDYISKYKIDNLKVAQTVIKREIEEGRYITNSKIAQDYPSTYTIYGKRLLDWKTKIEEEYYKHPGNPFVEFHYGDKHCGKSTYVEKFSDKEAYRLENHWFDGYNAQKILVIDEFNGSQLQYTTLLKILSGQQQRLEIKGSKELSHIKHVIITSNFDIKSLYQNLEYNKDQLGWRIDAIWRYQKSDNGFSERKCEKNPYLEQQHRKYLKQIEYHKYFKENWDLLEDNLSVTKNIFHKNYSTLVFDMSLRG